MILRSHRLLDLLPALVFAALACRSAPPPVRVAFDGPSHLVFVPVTVDGKDAGTWLLDSGFEYSVVSVRTATALSIPHGAAAGVAQPGGTVEQAWTKALPLAIGRVPFQAESLAVIDLSGLEPLVGRPIGGILGHDVFQRYVLSIDYEASALDFYEPATFRYRGKGVAVPVSIERGETFIAAQLFADGRAASAKLKLDTGSSSFVGLNGSWVDQNRFVSDARARIPVLGAALGGHPDHWATRLDSMALGPWRVAAPVVGYSVSLERKGDAGTVGADLLRRFHCIFDYAHQRIILEPRRALQDSVGFDASGLMIVATGARFDTLQVFAVDSGSPGAEAGLAPGDRIVDWSADGDSLTLAALRKRLDTPDQKLDLAVERDGARRVVPLVTRRRI